MARADLLLQTCFAVCFMRVIFKELEWNVIIGDSAYFISFKLYIDLMLNGFSKSNGVF